MKPLGHLLKVSVTCTQWWVWGWGPEARLKGGIFDDVIILSHP